MGIQFCPECNRILNIITKNEQKFARCTCGYQTNVVGEMITSETIKKPKHLGQGVASEENTLEGFPNVCSKCGYDKAEFTDLGAFYSDESNIYLFKCKKCGHTDKVTDGSSN